MGRIWLAKYEENVPSDVEIPGYPITQNLVNAVEKYPTRTALIFGNVVEPLGNALMDAKMDYRTLLDLTCRFAAAL